ncbi:TRAP transporter small permease subunit [uncultured Thioclava sp.]|uniref:TRAP transporter small permease n=1 Tax=uncultured Thioclava sp. TaxID=473858 RepID=UPI0025DF30D8|nr:TRAP transporter small permease subunit [uncultured Thioclava sp.]
MRVGIERAVQGLALAGGLVLLALVAMTVLSSLGALGLKGAQAGWLPQPFAIGPYKAGYEIVELVLPGIVFAMIPLVQLRHAHARVELLRGRGAHGFDVFWQVVAAAMFALIAWRIGLGMAGKMRSGTETFLLALPVWWGYAACLPGAWGAAIVAVYNAVRQERA